MSIISRFADIMSANINALLDKCEDPSKMIDEYLRKATEDLADVKKETAAVMAEEKRAKRELDENNDNIVKYDGLARKALTAGNEEDAKTFLAKKQTYEANAAELNRIYTIASQNASKMREMHDKLTKDIQSLESRRQNVKSKIAVAKTQEKINKVTTSMDKASGAMGAFDRMEKKADKMLDEANSMAELNQKPVDSADEIETKYAAGSPTTVDDELAKLKAEMGL